MIFQEKKIVWLLLFSANLLIVVKSKYEEAEKCIEQFCKKGTQTETDAESDSCENKYTSSGHQCKIGGIVSTPSSCIASDMIIENTGECKRKWYNEKMSVCVCNSEYCDSLPTIPEVQSQNYIWFLSSQDGSRFHMEHGTIDSDFSNNEASFQINPSKKYQKIIGFGGGFTDATGMNILMLSEEVQDKLLRSYFDSSGSQYTLGRVPIGGTDFSAREYSYMDNKDSTVETLELAEEDTKYKIPIIQKAMQLTKQLKLIGSAWTAPAWMKLTINGTVDGELKEEYFGQWSQYHIKFLEKYGKHNIKFWALSTGNEPLNAYYLLKPPFFNRMVWSPYRQSRWVSQNIGPDLKTAGYDDIKLFIFDENIAFLQWVDWFFEKQNTEAEGYFKKLNDAYEYVYGIATHWYKSNDWNIDSLQLIHSKYPDKTILSTEACCFANFEDQTTGDHVPLGSWKCAERYTLDIIKNLNRWVSGWIDWNLALDVNGGPNWTGARNRINSPIIVNSSANEFYKQPSYYALAHFSKFITPGSSRIESTPEQVDGVYVVAVKTSQNKHVIVFCNTNEEEKNVTFDILEKGSISIIVQKKSISTIIY